MPFNIQYDSDIDCVLVKFSGKITMKLVREYIDALLPVLKETGCRRLLSDTRGTELQLSSMDILQFPRLAAASILTFRLGRAVVASPGTSGYELYETLSKLQGQKVKVFSDYDEAKKWLLGEEG